jgi:saccharopine dehydrogenase (NAD+, L-lysine-forming)
MLGALLVLKNIWTGTGVKNVEEFDPDPFMELIGKYGLPWNEVINGYYPFND